jgi:hypothetical protein
MIDLCYGMMTSVSTFPDQLTEEMPRAAGRFSARWRSASALDSAEAHARQHVPLLRVRADPGLAQRFQLGG